MMIIRYEIRRYAYHPRWYLMRAERVWHANPLRWIYFTRWCENFKSYSIIEFVPTSYISIHLFRTINCNWTIATLIKIATRHRDRQNLDISCCFFFVHFEEKVEWNIPPLGEKYEKLNINRLWFGYFVVRTIRNEREHEHYVGISCNISASCGQIILVNRLLAYAEYYYL